MGNEIVYCSTCGERIPSADFEKGRALTILQRHYCKKCVRNVKEASPVEASTPSKSKEEVIPQAPRPRTARIPAMKEPSSRRWNPYLIAALIGALAIGLLLYVVLLKKN